MTRKPHDQELRDRFATELGRNFSVIAAAGSGKTTAIMHRIVAMAKTPDATERLPRLVVVTFTNRAANEMQQRARAGLFDAGADVATVAAFNRAFFGTLHSFCVKLLRDHGYVLGLPGRFEVLTDDTELWDEFFQSHATIGMDLSPRQRQTLLRHVQVRRLMELGRRHHIAPPEDPGEPPPIDVEPLLAYVPTGSAKRSIPAIQQQLVEWRNAFEKDDDFLPLPVNPSKSKDFVLLWNAAFQPFRRWLNQCALWVAAETAKAYRELRIARGTLTYADQVELALELFNQPDAARRMREKGSIVILDEAQDTDPQQFQLLLEITRPPDATGAWPATLEDPPAPGRFCMVGDFQQAIYGDRADLPFYRKVSSALAATDWGEELKFDVTFRLDRAQLDFVNATFQTILHGNGSQAAFVPLNPRPEALPGQIVRLEFEVPDQPPARDAERGRHEAMALAKWLNDCGLENLRAQNFQEIAILCPRKRWLKQLEIELRTAGLEVEVHSEREVNGDSPAYAWLTALAVIMARPEDGFQIVGVLREVFGISDHDLAEFSQGRGERFRIDRPAEGAGPIEDALNLLAECRRRALPLPLLDAVREMVVSTELRERLESLPAAEFPGMSEELDRLLAAAAGAEAEGAGLFDFAEHLRRNFNCQKEGRPASRDAINLITCQKAKGSQWQTVIVPFLARPIRNASPGYPRLARGCDGGWLALLEGADVEAEQKSAEERATEEELARVLYVALTRTRHTLVLVDDITLFSRRSLAKQSLAALLKVNAENARVFKDLASIPSACGKTREAQAARAEKAAAATAVPPLPKLAAHVETRARQTAGQFIAKLNPSDLAEARYQERDDTLKETEPELRPGALDNNATRYGTWWHELMQRLPWTSPILEMQAVFEEQLPRSTDPKRSAKEWSLLRAHLETGSGLASRLCAPTAIVHSEMPFLWKMNDAQCLEGVIDLAVFNPDSKRWLLLDWKTNRVTPAGAEALREKFLPQIAAYWQAMRHMLGAETDVAVYSTASGMWLEYGQEELSGASASMAAVPDV